MIMLNLNSTMLKGVQKSWTSIASKKKKIAKVAYRSFSDYPHTTLPDLSIVFEVVQMCKKLYEIPDCNCILTNICERINHATHAKLSVAESIILEIDIERRINECATGDCKPLGLCDPGYIYLLLKEFKKTLLMHTREYSVLRFYLNTELRDKSIYLQTLMAFSPEIKELYVSVCDIIARSGEHGPGFPMVVEVDFVEFWKVARHYYGEWPGMPSMYEDFSNGQPMTFLNALHKIFEGYFPNSGSFFNIVIWMPAESFLFVSLTIYLLYVAYRTRGKSKSELDVSVVAKRVSVLMGCSLLIMIIVPSYFGETKMLFNQQFCLDYYGSFVKASLLFFSLFGMLLLSKYVGDEKMTIPEYPIILGYSTAFSLLCIGSFDLFVFYITLEGASLLLIIALALSNKTVIIGEASVKYFIISSVASLLVVYGISVVYGVTGELCFATLRHLVATGLPPDLIVKRPLLSVGIISMIVGLLVKLGAAPFHLWIADVYEGSRLTVLYFLAVVNKFFIFCLLMRLLFYTFYFMSDIWSLILYPCAALSLILGSTAALQQKVIKRLLAYSSVNHIGFMLIGTFIDTVPGLQSAFFYLLIYIASSMLAFSALIYSFDESLKQHAIYLTDLGDLASRDIKSSLQLAVGLLSMAGIPPLAGFFAKYYVFFVALQQEEFLLAFLALFSSVLSIFYYLRIVKVMFFEKKKPEAEKIFVNLLEPQQSPFLRRLTTDFIIMFLLGFIFLSNAMLSFTEKIGLAAMFINIF